MPIHKTRRILQKFGIDVHRYHATASKAQWLQTFDINTVIDIGANTGQFAIEARALFPAAAIYSFEPLADCFATLTDTFKDDASFRAWHCAIGNTEKLTVINRNAYSQSSSLLPMDAAHQELFPHTKEEGTEQIHMTTLDTVLKGVELKDDILIKIDTQGYEDKVLRGGTVTFGKATCILEVSYIPLYIGQPLFHEIYESMRRLGFSYRGALHQKLNQKTGEIIFEDALFLREANAI